MTAPAVQEHYEFSAVTPQCGTFGPRRDQKKKLKPKKCVHKSVCVERKGLGALTAATEVLGGGGQCSIVQVLVLKFGSDDGI